MKKLKAVLQQSTSDCGSACIATILQYYGKTVSSRKIREAAGTDASGTSGLGIVKAAEKFGLSCTGILVTEKEKINTIPFPAIFQFKYDSTEHYIVPYGIKKDRVYYSDPEVGLTSDTIENFNTKWSGIAFLLHPTSEFEKGSDTRNVFSRFLVLLRPYRRYVAEAFLSSVFISAFGIFMSLYFRFLIDEVLYSQVKSTLNLCSICYLLVVVMQVLLNFCRNQILTYLGSKMDVSLVSDFYMHLLKLPLDFFTKRKTGEILSRINDANVIRNAVSSTLLSVAMDGVMVVLGAVFMAQMGSSLLLVSIIPVVISAIIVSILRKPFQSRIKAQAVHEAEKNAALYETINGIATVKGLATEDTAFLRCESRIVEAAMKNLELRKLGNTQNAILTFISSCGTLSMYWFGSFMIFKNQITLGHC